VGRGLSVRSVALAWLVAVGVDLFFNAGLFSGLFDQDREPGLLGDDSLFRRIPVAYLALPVGVAALGWIMDRADRRGFASGAVVGAGFGVVAGLLGVVTLWTAIEMTGLFVAAGAFVQVVEFASAGAVIGACKADADQSRVTRLALLAALLAAIGGIVAQNLIGAG
jgi:hypothetical protein